MALIVEGAKTLVCIFLTCNTCVYTFILMFCHTCYVLHFKHFYAPNIKEVEGSLSQGNGGKV